MNKYSEAIKHTKLLAVSYKAVLELAEAVEELANLENLKAELEAACSSAKKETESWKKKSVKAKKDLAYHEAQAENKIRDAVEYEKKIQQNVSHQIQEAQKQVSAMVAASKTKTAALFVDANSKVDEKKQELDELQSLVEAEKKKLEKLRKAVKEIVDRST